MLLMQNIVCKLDNKIPKKFARTSYCTLGGGGVNYPAVNQNDLSDRTLSLVKVECVMKTTDRASPLQTFTAQNITVFQ